MKFEGAREGNGEMFFRGWGGMLGFYEGGRGFLVRQLLAQK